MDCRRAQPHEKVRPAGVARFCTGGYRGHSAAFLSSGDEMKARLIRVTLLLILAAGTAVVVRALTMNPEYEWFKEQYGPARNSEHAEEWLIRDFFKDQRGGFFVDVGSYDYKQFSNTYYLEQTLGWSGIAIDAQQEFAADYEKYRPRTKFFALFVSDKSDDLESFFVPEGNRLVASSSKEFSDRWDDSGKKRSVRTITLNDLFEKSGVTRIDFLTMDIELAEPKALAGFDLARYMPRLVCVESHPEVRQQILDYFSERGYRVVGRFLRADPHNLWFAPATAPAPPGVDAGHDH
jgi:FkbM family methyltransferase